MKYARARDGPLRTRSACLVRLARANLAPLSGESPAASSFRRGTTMKGTRIAEQILCPMGCGRTTDDPLGGPCSDCWSQVERRVSSQPVPWAYRPRKAASEEGGGADP